MAETNHDRTKKKMAQFFLGFDPEPAARHFGLSCTEENILVSMNRREYAVSRKDGIVRDVETGEEAGFQPALTIYDILCCSKPDCRLSGNMENILSLSHIQGSSHALGDGFWVKRAAEFSSRMDDFQCASRALGGTPVPFGDASFDYPVFDFFPIRLQLWEADEEFPADLQIFADSRSTDFMHFETVWYAAGDLLSRICEEMDRL